MSNLTTTLLDVDGNVVRRRVQFYCEGESRTKQSMAAECDINAIMKRYERTGIITHLAKRDAYFADVSVVPDFAKAMEVVEKANTMFMSLPATVRKEFMNDPALYVEFCADPKNLPRLRELGLAPPENKAAVVQVEVVSPAVKAPGGAP